MLKKYQIKHRSFKQTMRLLRAAALASQETQGCQMKPTLFQLPFFEAGYRASATTYENRWISISCMNKDVKCQLVS